MTESVPPPFYLHWGWLLLRGLAALSLGLFGFLYPGFTLAVLTIAWGLYALTDGVLALVFASCARNLDLPAWPSIVIGALGISAGFATFAWPQLSSLALLVLVAGWAILVGASELVTAKRLEAHAGRVWALGLAGLLTIVFGALVLLRPRAGAFILRFSVSSFAVVVGLLLVLAALRMRDVRGSGDEPG